MEDGEGRYSYMKGNMEMSYKRHANKEWQRQSHLQAAPTYTQYAISVLTVNILAR